MINEFSTYLRTIKGYSSQTIAGYARDIKQFARYMRQHDAGARWSTITRADIDTYVTERAQAGHSAATTNRALSAISALYKYMQREGMKVENPCRYESRRKIADTVPNTIPYKDLERAYDDAHGAVKFMLGLLITTGMRIGELLAMRWEDIEWKTGRITLHGKGAKERVVITTQNVLSLAADAAAAAHYSGPMWHITQRSARTMIYDSLRGHTSAKQQSPHAIRHTVATHLAQMGVNTVTIAKVLGHNSTETTQRYIDAAAIDVTAALTNNNILSA